MRNLFKISALPIFILALSLGGIACGSDDDDGKGGGGSGGTANNGGTGGTDNPGGTGGTEPEPVTPSAECIEMCDHFYAIPCGFLDDNENNIPVEQCYQFCTTGYPTHMIECVSKMTACDNDTFQACKALPPTQECDELCDHVYSEECGLSFQTTTGDPVTYAVCKQQCPGTPWSQNEEITSCLSSFDCSEGTSFEERKAALEGCFPAE